MSARRTVLGLAVVSLALAGCSGPSDSTLDEALGSMGGLQDAERLSLQFTDVDAIRETVGYEGDGTERADPNDTSVETRWGYHGTKSGRGKSLDHPKSPRVPKGLTMSWTIENWATLDQTMAILHDVPDAGDVAATLAEEGWTKDGDLHVTDDLISWRHAGIRVVGSDLQVLSRSGQVTAEPDAERSALDDARVQALRECLGAPHLMYLRTVSDSTRTIALSVRAEPDGSSSATSCIHAPGEAEALASSLQPNNPEVSIESQEVNGDVITTTLRAPDDLPQVPGGARLIMRAAELPFPGF